MWLNIVLGNRHASTDSTKQSTYFGLTCTKNGKMSQIVNKYPFLNLKRAVLSHRKYPTAYMQAL